MRYDDDLKKAIEVINNPALYSKVLSSQWSIPRYESDVEGARYDSEYMQEVREDMEEE